MNPKIIFHFARIFASRSYGVFILCLLFALICILASCNVTRVVTNESKYTTRGDTAVMITTRTVETYDARKHLNY